MQGLKALSSWLSGVIACSILILSTTFFFIPILLLGILKLFPHPKWRALCTRCIDQMVVFWCDLNQLYVNKILKVKPTIINFEALDPKAWYLVVANHQSWLDIVILQCLFNRKIPILKFFIKDQLKWVPLLGFAWWAMGCPFMKRYSKNYLEKNPHKQGKDIAATRKAIDVFKQHPSTVMNFIEGTRFTPQKKYAQNSPYHHLLKPKAGGISFVLGNMPQQMSHLLDVTIVYNQPKHSLWDFMCRRLKDITIHVRSIAIPQQFLSPQILSDEHLKLTFREWLNEEWLEKDRLIGEIKARGTS